MRNLLLLLLLLLLLHSTDGPTNRRARNVASVERVSVKDACM